MTTYQINGMRIVLTTGKVAAANPDRFATVYGVFYDEKGDEKSFTSKEITFDMAKDPETVIDLEGGVLTIPSGKRGRTAYESISQADLAAELEALRTK